MDLRAVGVRAKSDSSPVELGPRGQVQMALAVALSITQPCLEERRILHSPGRLFIDPRSKQSHPADLLNGRLGLEN